MKTKAHRFLVIMDIDYFTGVDQAIATGMTSATKC